MPSASLLPICTTCSCSRRSRGTSSWGLIPAIVPAARLLSSMRPANISTAALSTRTHHKTGGITPKFRLKSWWKSTALPPSPSAMARPAGRRSSLLLKLFPKCRTMRCSTQSSTKQGLRSIQLHRWRKKSSRTLTPPSEVISLSPAGCSIRCPNW